MEKTRIIMTEVKSPYGKYTKFTNKKTGKILAEVDRRYGKYVIFGNRNELGSRTNKDSAIMFAQVYIREFIPDAEFKWSVVSQRIR